MYQLTLNPVMYTPAKADEIQLVLKQYKSIVARMNELFGVLSEKLGGEWQIDGIGTCGDGPHNFGDGLDGDLTYELPKLWEQVADNIRDNKELGGFGEHQACPYHAKDEGCILGDIKPARCAGYVEQSDESIRDVLGISRGELEGFLRSSLDQVMCGTVEPEHPDYLLGAQDNEAHVSETIIRINSMVARARRYAPVNP